MFDALESNELDAYHESSTVNWTAVQSSVKHQNASIHNNRLTHTTWPTCTMRFQFAVYI